MKFDPTRTGMIRKSFEKDMSVRFQKLWKSIFHLVEELDVFGLKKIVFMEDVKSSRSWAFLKDAQKVEAFRQWLKDRIQEGVLEVDKYKNRPWLAEYVESAYKKGIIRAFTDVRKREGLRTEDFLKGSESEFLRSSFGAPESVEKLELLYTRAFEQLKDVSESVSSKLSVILADGLASGSSPREIARTMIQSIQEITKKRALVIARTEIIRAHSEGQLLSFEKLGVEEVGIEAEWLTAGDEKVCDLCSSLEGTVLSVEEAKGLLPRHPNCRCCWIPALTEKRESGQFWGAEAEKRIQTSIEIEGNSIWAGKNLI